MATATVTSKGQITIPVSVRTTLGLDTGSRIEFVEFEKGQYALVPAIENIRSLKGMLKQPKKPVSIEDMNAAIASHGKEI